MRMYVKVMAAVIACILLSGEARAAFATTGWARSAGRSARRALRPRVHGYPDARHGRPRGGATRCRTLPGSRSRTAAYHRHHGERLRGGSPPRARRRDGRIRREAHREKRGVPPVCDVR